MDTKLTTILCSDAIGYSAQMQQDEVATLAKLNACRAVIDPLIDSHRGRLFNTGGDSILIEFASTVDAVRFGIEMQAQLRQLNNGLRWRIGIHLGEVWIYGTNLMGDAVNLAARTESLADYGGVSMTDVVYKLVSPKLKDYNFISRGVQEFKNIAPMEIWSVEIDGAEPNPYLSKGTKKELDNIPTKTHAELVAAVLNDQSARNRTLNDARAFKQDKQFRPAARVLMWRVTKQDRDSVDELVSMLQKDLVPTDLKPYLYAILREFCINMDSGRLIKIADSIIEDSPSTGLHFLKIASKVSEDAQYRYAMTVFNDAHSSDTEIESLLNDLKESAMKRRVPAMLNLGKYYLKINDKQNAFCWLYAARAEHNSEAQTLLEALNKTISRTDFDRYKINGDALVDEIKFVFRNNHKG